MVASLYMDDGSGMMHSIQPPGYSPTAGSSIRLHDTVSRQNMSRVISRNLKLGGIFKCVGGTNVREANLHYKS